MLLQLVLAIVMTVKAVGIDTPDEARNVIKWTQYFFLANIAAAIAMFIGTVGAISELKRSGVAAGKLITAAIGFAVTAIALIWTYRVVSNFVDIMLGLASGEDGEGGLQAL